MRALKFEKKICSLFRVTFVIFLPLLLPYVGLSEIVKVAAQGPAGPTAPPNLGPLSQVDYTVERPFKMKMGEIKEVALTLNFNKDILAETKKANILKMTFKTVTLSPQFNVLALRNGSKQVTIFRKHLEDSNFTQEFKLKLHATYIGHAILKPESIKFNEPITNMSMLILLSDLNNTLGLPITIVEYEGIWNTIFFLSVSLLMVISYINIGAQLDVENVQKIIKKPKTVILGFIITVILMPSASWITGHWFLGDQLLYRVGSFIFACGPAATASTLWTVMLKSDKELSVGLQVASSIGALVTMPTFLYSMDMALNLEGNQYQIKVPYARMCQTLLVLLIALFIGWRFVGRNERAQKFSSKIFRPLTFFVLLFIIVFSSIIYWYIYQMFDWTITLASFLITVTTYLISGLLGYLVNFDLDHGIAIAISSTYKNSGIAFAVLLVAFESPDTYIAFVPCLTQVVTTSLMLYIIYSCLSLVKCIRRRGQPNPIQVNSEEVNELNKATIDQATLTDETNGGKQTDNNNEFMAMITTDEIPKDRSSIDSTNKQDRQP